MANKLMYFPKDLTPSVDYNKWLKYLDTQLNELTNKNSIKIPKVFNVKPTNKKKTLGTSVMNSPMSPPFLTIPV